MTWHYTLQAGKNQMVRSISQNAFIITICVIVLRLNLYGEDTGTGDYIHYRLAVKYKSEKKYEAAIDEFRKALAAYPDNYNAYMHIAEIRVAENKPRLVIYNLKKALSYNPGWSKAHKMLSDAYELDGQYQKAIMELQQYQQTSDPAERDSLQAQIDRLIRKVSGESSVAEPVQESVSDVVDTGRSSSASPLQQLSGESTAHENVVESVGKQDVEKSVPVEKPKESQTVKTPVDQQFSRVVATYNDNKHQESLKLIQEVLKSSPGHTGAYYYAGLIRMKMGQPGMAKVNFMRSVAFPELGHNAHFYLGKIFAGERNFTEAIRQMKFYIAKTQYETGKKEAYALIESYKKELTPEMFDSIMKTGIVTKPVPVPPVVAAVPEEKYSQMEIRIDTLLSMLTIDTLSDVGRQLLDGINMFRNGFYDKSINAFRTVLAAKPSGPAAMHCIYNTGICYFKLGLFKEAENQFQQIIERFAGQPVAAQSLFLKAMTYLQRDESGVAEKLFRNFIQEFRHHSWAGKAYEMLGDAYIDLEEPKKAIDSYIQAASKESGGYKDRVFSQFKLGTTYLKIGNQTRAFQAFKKAIELGENHDIYIRIPDSYYQIADEYYKVKDYKNALEYYTRVTRKYPAFQETPWGLFQIGSIHKNLKDYQSAVKAFKDLIKRYPDDYWAKQAQWKLEDSIWENEYKAVLK